MSKDNLKYKSESVVCGHAIYVVCFNRMPLIFNVIFIVFKLFSISHELSPDSQLQLCFLIELSDDDGLISVLVCLVSSGYGFLCLSPLWALFLRLSLPGHAPEDDTQQALGEKRENDLND